MQVRGDALLPSTEDGSPASTVVEPTALEALIAVPATLLAAEPAFISTDVFPSFRLYEVRRLSTTTTTMARLAPYGEDVLVQELNSYMLVTKAGALNV